MMEQVDKINTDTPAYFAGLCSERVFVITVEFVDSKNVRATMHHGQEHEIVLAKQITGMHITCDAGELSRPVTTQEEFTEALSTITTNMIGAEDTPDYVRAAMSNVSIIFEQLNEKDFRDMMYQLANGLDAQPPEDNNQLASVPPTIQM